MKLIAVIKNPASIARYLVAVDEATEVPRRSPGRGPPYWKFCNTASGRMPGAGIRDTRGAEVPLPARLPSIAFLWLTTEVNGLPFASRYFHPRNARRAMKLGVLDVA